jgi:hypothetical protein
VSKLTNYQIAAQIRGLEAAISGATQRGDVDAVRRRQKKVSEYREELEQRQAAGLNPGTEIQGSCIVPVLKVAP